MGGKALGWDTFPQPASAIKMSYIMKNKLASLEATQVRNSAHSLTHWGKVYNY